MELQFAPLLDQVVTMKSEYTMQMSSAVNGILTPTTPTAKAITADNPFYTPPPFQPFSYSQSPTGYCQVSPIEFSPSDKPSSYGNNYGVVNDEGNYYSNYGYSSVADTPDSVFEGAKDENQFDYDDNYFKFDQDTVEKYMPHTDILNLDTEYVNYNEDNCNSKNQSPCSSPMDPWILSNAMIDSQQNVATQTIKIENNQQFTQLPSINQAFSTHFTTVDCENSRVENLNSAANNTYEQNLLDSFDATFFEQFSINEKSESNDANDMQPNSTQINPENYNYGDVNQKPNREYKNIWDEEKLMNAPVKDVEKLQNHKNGSEFPLKIEQDDGEQQQLVCCWKNCNQEFESQAMLVLHIEKNHVCCTKGDEYTCLWIDCPRQNRSFNARYKLLIHMRVHTGEKPNRCPVS